MPKNNGIEAFKQLSQYMNRCDSYLNGVMNNYRIQIESYDINSVFNQLDVIEELTTEGTGDLKYP